jgi:hypothetical protein
MIDPKLRDYVQKNIGTMGADAVRKKLLETGWDPSQVEEALKEATSAVSKPAASPAAASPTTTGEGLGSKLPLNLIFVIAIVAIGVVALVVGYPYIVPGETECGNGVCEFGETLITCPVDCQVSNCGNGVCDAGETSASCPADCVEDLCGNGVCDTDETFFNCQEDCTPPPIGVSINIAQTSVSVGDQVTVEIIANQATDLFGFQFEMNYDPSVLSFREVSDGSFFNSGGADQTFCVTPNTATAGQIKNYACTRLKDPVKGVVGLSGTGVIAVVTFDANSPGTSQITLDKIFLSDTSARSISPEVYGGGTVSVS